MALKCLKQSRGVPILSEGQRRAVMRVKARNKKQNGKKGKMKSVPLKHPVPWDHDFALLRSRRLPCKNHYVGFDRQGKPQPKKVYNEELGERAQQIERLRSQAEIKKKQVNEDAERMLKARQEARWRQKIVEENTSSLYKPQLPQAISPQHTPRRYALKYFYNMRKFLKYHMTSDCIFSSFFLNKVVRQLKEDSPNDVMVHQ